MDKRKQCLDVIELYRELQVQICVICDLICGVQCVEGSRHVKKAEGTIMLDDATCELYYHHDLV